MSVDINLTSRVVEIETNEVETIWVSPRRAELVSQQLTVISDTTSMVEVVGRGAQGPPGPPGASGGVFIHQQVVPSATWLVEHNFGRAVNVDVYDETGCVVGTAVIEISPNSIEVRANKPFAGRAVVA